MSQTEILTQTIMLSRNSHADIYIQPNVNCELSPKQFERSQGQLENNIKQNVQFVYQKKSILPQILQPEARLEAESLLALRVLVTELEPQVQVDLDAAQQEDFLQPCQNTITRGADDTTTNSKTVHHTAAVLN